MMNKTNFLRLTASPLLPAFCFSHLESQLTKAPTTPQIPLDVLPNDPSPIFVCYKRLDGNLRGCIGNFSAEPLQQQLCYYALESALKDRRFDPIRLQELPQLKCTVSLLHTFEDVGRWNEWEIGTHGIQISFSMQRRQFKATYLPHVAPEQRWNHQEAIESLIRKAGYQGRVNQELLQILQVTRYQESEACVTYEEAQKIAVEVTSPLQ